MLVVTSRLEPDAPLRKIETPSQQIRLEPLLAATATDLVRSIAKDAALSPKLLEEIVNRCEAYRSSSGKSPGAFWRVQSTVSAR